MRARACDDKNKGNYIRDDTAIQNNKDYLNQQHQQLVSTTCKAPQKAGGFFGDPAGNQLPAALKESHVSVNKYINPKIKTTTKTITRLAAKTIKTIKKKNNPSKFPAGYAYVIDNQ